MIVFSASTTSALAGAARRANALYVLPKEHSTADKIVAIISRIFPGSMKRKFQTVDSARPAELIAGVQVEATTPQGRGKVLVAEDDPVTLSIITDVIEKEGYTVIAARDGREAYNLLRRDADIEAAVFDVMMPHIVGTDLLRYIRHNKLLKDIPILIITAQTSINIQTDVFASGVSQFAVKPFTRAELRRKFLGLMSSAKS
ncbi:MAG: response regulator [Pyrinomonadaceae bacterium]